MSALCIHDTALHAYIYAHVRRKYLKIVSDAVHICRRMQDTDA